MSLRTVLSGREFGVSKALLAQRLELLEYHGTINKHSTEEGRSRFSALTDKGRELKTIGLNECEAHPNY